MSPSILPLNVNPTFGLGRLQAPIFAFLKQYVYFKPCLDQNLAQELEFYLQKSG